MFIYLPIQLFYKEKKLLFILLVLCPLKIFIFHTIILLTTYSYLFSRLILRGFSGFYEWDHHVFQECVEMSGNWDNGRLWINGINGILFHIALQQCAEEEVKGAPHKGLKILEGLQFENWAALIGCYLPICYQLHTHLIPIHNLPPTNLVLPINYL